MNSVQKSGMFGNEKLSEAGRDTLLFVKTL